MTKIFVKKILVCASLIFISLISFAEFSHSAPLTPAQARQKTIYSQICAFRKAICGPAKTAIITMAVFLLGALAVSGKIEQSTLIIILVGMFIFMSSMQVMMMISARDIPANVALECVCV